MVHVLYFLNIKDTAGDMQCYCISLLCLFFLNLTHLSLTEDKNQAFAVLKELQVSPSSHASYCEHNLPPGLSVKLQEPCTQLKSYCRHQLPLLAFLAYYRHFLSWHRLCKNAQKCNVIREINFSFHSNTENSNASK